MMENGISKLVDDAIVDLAVDKEHNENWQKTSLRNWMINSNCLL